MLSKSRSRALDYLVAFAACLAASLAATKAVAADQSSDRAMCSNRGNPIAAGTEQQSGEAQSTVPLEVIIDRCTVLIQSGKLSRDDRVSALTNRGSAYNGKGDVDSAVADFDEAIRLDPKHALAFLGRGNSYALKGNFDRAIADFDEAIRLSPKLAAAFNSRCWARAARGRDLQKALDDCNESLRLEPDNPAVLDSRGFTNLRLGQVADAIADYDAVLKHAPKVASSLYGRGLAKRKAGDGAGGDADVAAAKAIDPGIGNEFARLGVN
jgi:tetratricopeptide (TPR) repeat protein